MLIRSMEAENFMKFSKLRLSGLPERGVIGVEGPNESGKSTIGEAILFAFFGRSRISKDCPLENLIHWGSDFLRVSVEFVLNADGDSDRDREMQEHFVVFREVDRFGTNFVKVLSIPERQEVAVGNIEVAKFFAARIKFDFFEFQHAFYHDQYRSRYVDEALREFVERLTGVRQMQTATESIREEVERLEREFSHFHRDVKRNLKQIERHAAGAERLDGLREESGEATKRVEEQRGNVNVLERVQNERKKIQSERESVEKRLRAMSGLGGQVLEDEVADLMSCHESLERRAQTDGVLRDDLVRDFARVRDGVGRVDELLRDYRELRGVFVESHESMQADLSESKEDSLIQRRFERASEIVSIKAKAVRKRLGLVVFGIIFLIGAGVAVSGGLQRDLAAMWGLPETIRTLYLIVGGALAALIALILAILKIANLVNLKGLFADATSVVDGLDSQIAKARDGVEKLDKLRAIEKSATIRDYVHKARGAAKATTARRLAEFESKHAELLSGGDSSAGRGGLSGLCQSLGDREKHLRQKLLSFVQAESKKLKDAESQLKKATSERDRVDNEVRECETHVTKKEILEEKNRELEAEASRIRDSIDDRQSACELLNSCRTMTRRKVGPALASYMYGVVPRLTNGRYREVKLDDDLQMQVFSADRRDFIAAAELSGGTNEALVLGLRLALSQAFVTARTRQSQFVFLDEPFKMMDNSRVLKTILALPSLSQDIEQFFVVQPHFTDEQRDALGFVIQTTVKTAELEVSFATR